MIKTSLGLCMQDFARREIIPFAAEWDDRQHFPVDMLRNAAQLGFGAIFCGQDVGGTGYVSNLDITTKDFIYGHPRAFVDLEPLNP